MNVGLGWLLMMMIDNDTRCRHCEKKRLVIRLREIGVGDGWEREAKRQLWFGL